MFGCRRLDEDLKFPWFEGVLVDVRSSGEHVLFFFLFSFTYLVNALFLVVVIPGLYLHNVV